MESDRNERAARGIDPAEAQEALLVVERMRRAALRRGLPPRWFGGVISLLAGGLCGAQAAGASPAVNAGLLMGLMLLFASMRRTLMAVVKRSSYGFSFPVVSAQIAAIVLIMAMVVGGRIGFIRLGLAWAPFAAAAVSAATIYLLFEFKMAQLRANIEAGERS